MKWKFKPWNMEENYLLSLRFKSKELEAMFVDYFWMKRAKYYMLWIVLAILCWIPATSWTKQRTIDTIYSLGMRATLYAFFVLIGQVKRNLRPYTANILTFMSIVGPFFEAWGVIKEIEKMPDCSLPKDLIPEIYRDDCDLRIIGYPSLKYTLDNLRSMLTVTTLGIRWCVIIWGRIALGLTYSYAVHKEIQMNYLLGVVLITFLGHISSMFIIYTLEKQERYYFYLTQLNIVKQRHLMLHSLVVKHEQDRKASAAFKGVKIKIQNMLLLASSEPVHLSNRLQQLLAKAKDNCISRHSKTDFQAFEFPYVNFNLTGQINLNSLHRWRYFAETAISNSSSTTSDSKSLTDDDSNKNNSNDRFITIQIGYIGIYDVNAHEDAIKDTKAYMFPTTEPCIIKTVEPVDTLNEAGLQELMNRIFLMCSIRHESIIKTYGYSIQKRVCTFHEYLPVIKGKSFTLLDVVNAARSGEGKAPSLSFVVDAMLQIVNLLEYLHKKGISHGNVTLSSVFIASLDDVTDSGEIIRATCKLSEISISYIFTYASNSYNLSPGRRKSKIDQEKKPSSIFLYPSTDIFQLGCCFWELLTLDQPILNAISPLALDQNIPNVLVQLILDCLDDTSAARPGIGEVKRLLKLVRNDLR